MQLLKDLWARWKVHVSVVGGVLVLASVWGTCSYEPPAADEAVEDEAVEDEAVEDEAVEDEAVEDEAVE